MQDRSGQLRNGFTTGSCVAACAKAACFMLFTGTEKRETEIITPKGIVYRPRIINIKTEEHAVTCFVKKDSGDDPDVTNHALVGAKVSLGVTEEIRRKEEKQVIRSFGDQEAEVSVFICAGTGVGTVTKAGLNMPVGASAINQVPREMITKEVLHVCRLFDYSGEISVEAVVINGEELAAQTFNPRLGIEGGISILGTTGVIEPMSTQALIDTIRAEMSVHRAAGEDTIVLAFGNYGQDFLKETYGYDVDRSVKISNFAGEAFEIAADLGFKQVLLLGHIGKLIKVSGGIMNTHSREGDCRMELLAAAALRAGADASVCRRILSEVTTEAGLAVLKEAGILEDAMDIAMERILYYLDKKSSGKFQTECIMYSTEFGLLSETAHAGEVLRGTFCGSGLRSSGSDHGSGSEASS